MKNTTRILMALLAMILCLTTFVACNGGDDTTGTTTPAPTTPVTPDGGDKDPAPAPTSDYINIIANDATEYQIVYGAGASDWEKAAAYEFQAAILTLTGIEIPVVSDFEDCENPRQSKEIVIGFTNRADEYYVPVKSAYQPGINEGYVMFIDGERLVALASAQSGMYYAFRDFIQQQFGYGLDDFGQDVTKLPAVMVGGDTSIELHNALFFGAAFNNSFYPALGTSLENFKIYFDGTTWLYGRMAYALQTEIEKVTGVLVPVVPTPDKETSVELQEDTETGAMKEVVTELPLTNYFQITSSSNYAQGNYNVSWDSTNNAVVLTANTYQGWLGAIAKITNANKHGYVAFGTAPGAYKTTAVGDQSSAKYTYDRDALRIMFYNVMGGDADLTLAERNYLQYKMLEQYMPDVIGLQEVDAVKRVGNGDLGSYGLADRLVKLGYAEAADTVVEGVATVSGNNTNPIYYNTKTTVLVASGAKAFATADNVNYPDNWIDTGIDNAAEKASQSVSWMIFQSLEDEAYYMIVNVQFSTTKEATRMAQAQEVLALIAEVSAMEDGKYADITTFIGGGIYGKGDNGYELFASSDYVAMQGYDLVHNNTDVKSTLTAAPSYDANSNVVQEGGNVQYVGELNGQGSVDQIFVGNLTKQSTFRVFGVIADDFTTAASDHLPIFVDYLNVEDWGPAV